MSPTSISNYSLVASTILFFALIHRIMNYIFRPSLVTLKAQADKNLLCLSTVSNLKTSGLIQFWLFSSILRWNKPKISTGNFNHRSHIRDVQPKTSLLLWQKSFSAAKFWLNILSKLHSDSGISNSVLFFVFSLKFSKVEYHFFIKNRSKTDFIFEKGLGFTELIFLPNVKITLTFDPQLFRFLIESVLRRNSKIYKEFVALPVQN